MADKKEAGRPSRRQLLIQVKMVVTLSGGSSGGGDKVSDTGLVLINRNNKGGTY